jgi:hypothetical protein
MKQLDLLRLNQAKPAEIAKAVDAQAQPLLDKVKAGTYAVPAS